MDRSVLARKPMTELKDIAAHLNMRGYQKLRKAELIDAIVESATGQAAAADAARNGGAQGSGAAGSGAAGNGGAAGSSNGASEDDSQRTRTRTRNRNDDEAPREEHARKVLPPGARDDASQDDPAEEADEAPRGRSRNGGGQGSGKGSDSGGAQGSGKGSDSGGGKASGNGSGGGAGKGSGGGGVKGSGKGAGADDPSARDTSNADDDGDDDDDEDDDNSSASRKRRSRRERRKRNRERAEQESGSKDNEPGEVRAGVLDILPEGYGFLRTTGYLPGDRDVYVSQGQIRKHGLRRGDVVQGPIRQQRSNEKVPALHHVQKVNGGELVDNRVPDRPDFRDLVPVYPTERVRLETDKGSSVLRAIDLVVPLGKGQRALLVAPPAAGRTDTLKGIGQAIADNHPDAHLMVLLVDERPEDVTDVQRSIPGEVIHSTFDRPAEDHVQVAELAMERARRLVELGHDVVVLVDSLTRLARSYGPADTLTLHPAKRVFGTARNIEDGGSLTMVATLLVGTGSATDELIRDELVDTANAVIALSGDLEPHRRPALDVAASGTRREELLVSDEELQQTWALVRELTDGEPDAAALALQERIEGSASNAELLGTGPAGDE